MPLRAASSSEHGWLDWIERSRLFLLRARRAPPVRGKGPSPTLLFDSHRITASFGPRADIGRLRKERVCPPVLYLRVRTSPSSRSKRTSSIRSIATAGPQPPRASPRIIPASRVSRPRPSSARPLPLADAQLVLAREYGFDSWARLKQHVELADAVARFQSAPALRRSGCRAWMPAMSIACARCSRRILRWPTRAPISTRRSTTSPARRCCTTWRAIPIAAGSTARSAAAGEQPRDRAGAHRRRRRRERATLGPTAATRWGCSSPASKPATPTSSDRSSTCFWSMEPGSTSPATGAWTARWRTTHRAPRRS